MKILLGSASPRRKELLKSLGYDFETVKIECDEIYQETLAAEQVAAFLSELKSQHFRDLEKGEILITADTIVVINGEILGKPENRESAIVMLQKLSNNTHQVYTAFTIRTEETCATETDLTLVDVGVLTSSEIENYVDHFKVLDKAGSYGVQDWLGMAKITKIEGSFYTVMGLPTHLLYEKLKTLHKSS